MSIASDDEEDDMYARARFDFIVQLPPHEQFSPQRSFRLKQPHASRYLPVPDTQPPVVHWQPVKNSKNE